MYRWSITIDKIFYKLQMYVILLSFSFVWQSIKGDALSEYDYVCSRTEPAIGSKAPLRTGNVVPCVMAAVF